MKVVVVNHQNQQDVLKNLNIDNFYPVKMQDYEISCNHIFPDAVLYTYGIGPCVSLIGYNPKLKMGFMTHYGKSSQFLANWEELTQTLLRINQKYSDPQYPGNYELAMVSCCSINHELITTIEKKIAQYQHLFSKNIYKDLKPHVEQWIVPKEAALDLNSGKLYIVSDSNKYNLISKNDWPLLTKNNLNLKKAVRISEDFLMNSLINGKSEDIIKLKRMPEIKSLVSANQILFNNPLENFPSKILSLEEGIKVTP